MLTKKEILEKADIRFDTSIFDAQGLEKLNEMFGGDYAKHFAKTSEDIERGVDLFLSAVGKKVTVWNNGKSKNTVVVKIDYDKERDYFFLFFEDKGSFGFRNMGFSCLGSTGEYYGICNDPQKKSGICFNLQIEG